MLQVKSAVTLKANPGNLNSSGGILFRIWKHNWNEKDRKKYCEAKKDAMRVAYMAMDYKA